MDKFGYILAGCGVFFGLVALISDEASFACISSITIMSAAALLIDTVQRHVNKAAH